MLVIKDSMVLIHLAKMTLLELSCDYFRQVSIPVKVKDEVFRGTHSDTHLIKELIKKNKIKVKDAKDISLIKRANEFNIQRAEAEVIALYWEMKADLIATDDDNVRKKREILKLNVIGTPAITLKLYKEKKISKTKVLEAIHILKKVGWFANTIWDKILLEVDKNG